VCVCVCERERERERQRERERERPRERERERELTVKNQKKITDLHVLPFQLPPMPLLRTLQSLVDQLQK
jgi:hypothetical protein